MSLIPPNAKLRKPWLALDVNGPIVLSPGSKAGGRREAWAGDFPVLLDAKIEIRLRALSRHFQFVWSTSWQSLANDLISPLVGLPQYLPFVNFRAFLDRDDHETPKLPALQVWLRDQPAAIVDNVIGSDMRAWATQRCAPTLLVEVDRRHGLQDIHVLELMAASGFVAVRRSLPVTRI